MLSNESILRTQKNHEWFDCVIGYVLEFISLIDSKYVVQSVEKYRKLYTTKGAHSYYLSKYPHFTSQNGSSEALGI